MRGGIGNLRVRVRVRVRSIVITRWNREPQLVQHTVSDDLYVCGVFLKPLLRQGVSLWVRFGTWMSDRCQIGVR